MLSVHDLQTRYCSEVVEGGGILIEGKRIYSRNAVRTYVIHVQTASIWRLPY